MLAPVLSLWGQEGVQVDVLPSEKSDTTMESYNTFPLVAGKDKNPQEISHAIDDLKSDQNEILKQYGKCKGVRKEDVDKAKKALDETFKNLDSVLSIRDKIVRSGLDKFKYLILEADTVTKGFINKYREKISGNDDQVLILSEGFLIIATEYSKSFEKYIKKANLEFEENDKLDEKNKDDDKVIKDSHMSLIWIIIAIAIALISLGLNIFTLFKIEKKARAIKDNRLQIEELERTLTHKIKGIQGSSAQDSSYQSKPNKYAPTHGLYTGIQQSKKGRPGFHQVIKENPNVEKGDIKPTETQHSGNKQTVHKQPEVTYLYATIKAQSPLAEFVKVTGENAGDKIFMLKLDNPEADTAEFTISDMMTSDFMKSVILDRDTYLKVQFCDKAIVSANPTKIIVETPGKAKKVDGKWMVQDRMTLRLV